MVDSVYKNAFKEVFEILQNTDEELVKKVPRKFIDFLHINMNKNYQTNINFDIEIDKQKLLRETEEILSLIYRSYWATDEEKVELAKSDREELIRIEEEKKSQYKDIEEIFEKRRNINKVTIDNSLAVIEKESFVRKILNKILKFLRGCD